MRPSSGLLALLAPLAVFACRPAASQPSPSTTRVPAAEPTTPVAVEPEPAAPPSAVVYGQFRIPNPEGLLAQVSDQLVPPAQRGVLDLQVARSLAGSMLGPRSAVATHVDLSRPLGCVITSPKQHDLPVACVVGYDGGFGQLMDDLGPEGYVSGGDDYAAYHIEGQAYYLNAMGEHVAFSFAPDLTAATRDRLKRDIIDAGTGVEDLAGSAYLGTIFEDSRAEIEDAIERTRTPATSSSEYQRIAWEAQRRQWLSFGELDRADVWLDLFADGVRVGYRGQARPGTATSRSYESQARPQHDPALLELLPAESFLVGSMTFDADSMSDDPMLGAYMQALDSLGDSGTTAALARAFRTSLTAWAELSTGHASLAMLHLRGTRGGVVTAYRVRPGVDATAKLREVFESYRELSPQNPLPFEMKIRRRAVRAGKVRGDLVTMRPSAQVKDDPVWGGLARALGRSPQVQGAYAQRGDVLYMALSIDKAERYLARALAAGAGQRGLKGRKKAMELLAPHARDSLVLMSDVSGVVDWLSAVGLIDALPKPLGGELDDVVISMRPGAEPGQREFFMEASQPLIDGLFALSE